MILKRNILSVLNADQDFFFATAKHLGEQRKCIEASFDPIIGSISYALYVNCVLNGRLEEICRIAKECSVINFRGSTILNDSSTILKGTGANSELFSGSFGKLIEFISDQHNLKTGSVYRLFSVLTPVVLSNVYFIYRANNYSPKQFSRFLENLSNSKRLNWDLRNEISSLADNEPSPSLYDYTHTKLRKALDSSKILVFGLFKNIFGKLAAKV